LQNHTSLTNFIPVFVGKKEEEEEEEEVEVEMDQFDDSIKNQIAALLRVINVTRCFKEDNVPCEIEEVIEI
jgi:hypothetical protein